MDARVEPAVALDCQAGSIQLCISLDLNEEKGVPGRRPPAEVQRIQPERLVRDENVVVTHDDTPWRLPYPLWGGKGQGGSRRGGRGAVALNAQVPSRGHHSCKRLDHWYTQISRACRFAAVELPTVNRSSPALPPVEGSDRYNATPKHAASEYVGASSHVSGS